MSTRRIPAFAGELIEPGDPRYERARRVWNHAVDRRPALIARCGSTQDVVNAMGMAHQSGMTVSVRGGGHHFAGLGVCDGGLVIDLSPMKRISVNAEGATALVQPGVTWGELDAATQAFGLATTGADVPSVGVAGCTLPGGLGWLHRVAGLSCDNLLSAEVVTATGQVLRAAPDEHDDLFWALRGGGGNFGIVTDLEFRLHPVREVLGGMLLYPYDRAREALHTYHELSQSASDDLFLRAMLVTAPPAPFVPADLRGRPAALLSAAYFGPPGESERVLRPLRELGPAAADLIRPMSYLALQRLTAEGIPPDVRAYVKSEWLSGLSGDVIDDLAGRAATPSSPASIVELQPLGGAASRVGAADTAVAWRRAAHLVAVIGLSPTGISEEATKEWVRTTWAAALPASAGGGYSGNLMDDEGAERVRASYGSAYAGLARIKSRYDPGNFFRVNANVAPGTGA